MISLRDDVLKYIRKTYKGEIEYPWMRYPDYGVVRHKDNQKWYALFMDIPRSKLGPSGDRFHDSIEGRHHGIMYRLVSGDCLKWVPMQIL